MEQLQEITKPMLFPLKDGWAAYGDGWGVHGFTQEEAIENFRKAEERYKEIDNRPVWYEKNAENFL